MNEHPRPRTQEFTIDGDEVVAKVLPPRVEIEEAPAAEVAEAEAEGAEAGEGEAAQEAAAGAESESRSTEG